MANSNNNPKLVLDTVIDANAKPDVKISVYPLTITRYAFLEKLDSPFINQDVDYSMANVIPSAYVMCSDNQTLRQYGSSKESLAKLTGDAFDWADQNIGLFEVKDMIDAILDQICKLMKAMPEGSAGKSVSEGGSKKK